MKATAALFFCAVCLLVAGVYGCGKKAAATHPGQAAAAPEGEQSPGTSFLSSRGKVMPLREALDGVRFRPFIPSRQIVETALIPAYNGDDIPEDRGIAFEYVSNRQSFVLSQWPHHGSVISGTRRLGTDRGCPLSAYPIGLKPGHEGVIWNNAVVIASLQPSGDASTKATVDEAHRLVALGACR